MTTFAESLEQNSIDYVEANFMVLTKAGEGGVSKLVPMKLWPAQKHYAQNRTNRDAILKNRQQGTSTGVESLDSQMLFTQPYQRQTLITHDDETSEFLFQTIERFYRNLPWNRELKSGDKMLPKRDWASGRRMRFPVIDSYIYIDSAKSDAIGIGHGLNVAHLSEVARWPTTKAQQLFADISQTVPPKGYITMESTPKGRQGLFPEVYSEAKEGKNGYKAFFYPWWWDVTCVSNDVSWLKDDKAEIVAAILNQSVDELKKFEKRIAEEYTLSPQQIAFRRQKISELKDLFFQEYPENDLDCWLSGEMAVIEGASLRPYYLNIRNGHPESQYLTIWKDVIGGRNYVIGADVASGSARDYSVASVIDVRTMEYVARLRGKIHTDMFAEMLFQLGIRYNIALIAVERIGHGHSVLRVLLEKEYPNLYYHTDYDDLTANNITDAGWKTSVKTKPLMVNGMIAAFRAEDLISWSENLLEEASSLTWEGGVDSKVKTASGKHDDEFMAVSIALQVREIQPLTEYQERSPVEIYATI